MFATDRDLLVLEPNLFRDAAWVGQRMSRGVGSITGTMLSIPTPDVALDQAGVDAGNVVTIGGASYEVIERLSDTELTISRLRNGASWPPLPPMPVSGVEAVISTFSPQIAIVHAQVLRMLGLQPASPEPPDEGCITNPADFVLLESLGALHLVFAAASSLSAQSSVGICGASRLRFQCARRACKS